MKEPEHHGVCEQRIPHTLQGAVERDTEDSGSERCWVHRWERGLESVRKGAGVLWDMSDKPTPRKKQPRPCLSGAVPREGHTTEPSTAPALGHSPTGIPLEVGRNPSPGSQGFYVHKEEHNSTPVPSSGLLLAQLFPRSWLEGACGKVDVRKSPVKPKQQVRLSVPALSAQTK